MTNIYIVRDNITGKKITGDYYGRVTHLRPGKGR